MPWIPPVVALSEEYIVIYYTLRKTVIQKKAEHYLPQYHSL